MKSCILIVSIICASLLLSQVSCGGCSNNTKCGRGVCVRACKGDDWTCLNQVNGNLVYCTNHEDCKKSACNECLHGKSACSLFSLRYYWIIISKNLILLIQINIWIY